MLTRIFQSYTFTPESYSAPLQVTQMLIHFYVSKFKHYNYRYLVPILIFLSQLSSVHQTRQMELLSAHMSFTE